MIEFQLFYFYVKFAVGVLKGRRKKEKMFFSSFNSATQTLLIFISNSQPSLL
jgi:hypothetical protein